MLRNIRYGLIFAGLGPLCITANADPLKPSDCEAHYAAEGSLLTGKKYSTWVEFDDVSKTDAYSRIYASIAKDGWTITQADKDAGVISATQQVSYGKGSQAPLVIVIEASKAGSKATATFRTGGGQSSKEETVRTKLCSYLGAASTV